MVEVEVKASFIDVDSCSREDFKRCSTQGRIGLKVLKTNVWSSKTKVEMEGI
jgi:hypothetical protein